MQVYLPDDLYEVLKARRPPASELLQRALRSELRRLDLLAETNRYLDGLVARVGAPTARDRQRAATIANRVAPRTKRRAG
jgi:post-segregation antitoxin (ccd killing protein)